MAALDIRHLSAPFSNKLNLIVIISIVVLFAIFRLSVSEKAPQPKAVQQPPQLQLPQELPKPVPRENSGANLIDELLGDQAPRKSAEPLNQNESVAPFKDIEEALGIGR